MNILIIGFLGILAGTIMRDCKNRFGNEVFYIMMTVLVILTLAGIAKYQQL